MFLLIDNYDSFTFNVVQEFQKHGADPVVLRNDRPELTDPDFAARVKRLCISPGPSHPRNAGHCLRFLDLIRPDIPVLGICLGHQILAAYAGVKVGRASRVMHGKVSQVSHGGRSLFTGLTDPMDVCRYHSLAAFPNGTGALEVTATADDGEVMALAYTDRPWVGVQFHPESILTPDGPKLLGNFLEGNY